MPRSRRELSSINFKALDKHLHIDNTPQSIDRPLFELLECNLRCWWGLVKVQPVRILLLLVEGCGKLLFLVINSTSTLWVNTIEVLSDHSKVI